MQGLHMHEDNTTIVSRFPDRDNIILDIIKQETRVVELDLSVVIPHLNTYRKQSIFLKFTVGILSNVYITLQSELGHYVDMEMVDMFHKITHPASKERIINEF